MCPFQGGQHFWGGAVHRAGAGPEPLEAKKLTAEHLAAAISSATTDAGMRSRATELSQRIDQEDGTGQASEQIEDVLATRRGGPSGETPKDQGPSFA